ncbi:hypothetical protein BBJ29_000689 [Phytophthora kernoviae]|uniref:Uncharacterized protein n=1 Tax=Phytophthora kernoviae TaxID=325452 RepID=A0A3R7GRJ5_9STRA|nr:hypothetical protein BBJ29_000689 [Phytophthora kernoviae]
MDVNTNVDSSVVIDLTEEDDEEEDEPMGQNNQKATISDEVSTVEATMTTQVEEAVGGPGGESSAAAAALVTEPRPQTKPTEPTSEAIPDLGEEVESDVDEAWPSVPSPASSRAKRTKEEKGTALEGARNTLQHSQNEQEDKRRVQDGTNDNEREGRFSLEDSNEEMEVDVDEELPNQAPTPGKSTSTSPDLSSAYRIVELENLEDGEIYEEGAGTSSSCCSANEATQDIGTRGYEGHGFFVFIITIFSGLRSTQTFRAFQPRN